MKTYDGLLAGMRGFWHTLPIRDRETLLEVCEELTPDIRRRWALRKQKQIEAKLLRIDEDCRLRDRVEQRNAAILDSVPRIQTLDAERSLGSAKPSLASFDRPTPPWKRSETRFVS
mmetsp:Transcript_15016/g.56989  ORF Transcript_15016/g.56989 Transcript_15016/m.56989 type:complete len:116 (-) Transcript_15016:206-553(-)